MDDLTPDELALIQQHRRERAVAAAEDARWLRGSKDKTRPLSEKDNNNIDKDNIDEDNNINKDDLVDKAEDDGKEEDICKNISKGHFKLLLPPIDIGYTSKEYLCEDV